MDICFLTCICLRHISQIQTCLCEVVEPGIVSTSAAFMRVRIAGLSKKKDKYGPHCWGRVVSTQYAQQFVSAVTAPPLVDCVVWSLLIPHHHQNLVCGLPHHHQNLVCGLFHGVVLTQLLHTRSPYVVIVYLLLSGGRESDLPACGPQASFSVHLASSYVTPAGSVHKSRGANVGEVEEMVGVTEGAQW